ncbi:MAG: GntR family transcriptional regulator [Pseudomonadota bacterium]|nr:GntR family transcriptional regulator [Pseudomonadota bacterium]
MSSQVEIARQVVESILAQKLQPGERLGEQELADLFGVSRTLVREALMQLQARGFVEVRSRKGWYVVEPSMAQAHDAFSARRAVESGLLRQAIDQGRPLQAVVARLRKHVRDERAALDDADAATRAFLLADFHVCLAECLGHKVLADMLRDLTARTTLVATLYQSTHDAAQSCAEHADIVAAIDQGDLERAAVLMLSHIGNVEQALGQTTPSAADARERLRNSLAPLVQPQRHPRSARPARALFAEAKPKKRGPAEPL